MDLNLYRELIINIILTYTHVYMHTLTCIHSYMYRAFAQFIPLSKLIHEL